MIILKASLERDLTATRSPEKSNALHMTIGGSLATHPSRDSIENSLDDLRMMLNQAHRALGVATRSTTRTGDRQT